MAEPAPAILCLTPTALRVAEMIATATGGAVHGRRGRVRAPVIFDETIAHVRMLFAAGTPIVGICAAGILIRAVAPLLADKHVEPPVVAVAEDGSAVVPLLGGHHGGNSLARSIACTLGVDAAITTAGDILLGTALDAPPPGWRLRNPDDAARVMADLVSGAEFEIEGEAAFLSALCRPGREAGSREAKDSPGRDAGGEGRLSGGRGMRPPGEAVGRSPVRPAGQGGTASSSTTLRTGAGHLTYDPLHLTLGVGCARNCPAEELATLVRDTLAAADLPPTAIAGVFSLDLKADEAAVTELAATLGVPARFFDAARLESETPRLANPSDVVFAEVGCHGVAEAAALAAAGADAELVVAKRKSANATAAVALARTPLTGLPGRPRGRVALVGIGPGQADWRTPEASRLIAGADELVGYGLYIDLLGPLAAGKPRRDFPLGGEEDRCRYALEAAGTGREIALICSGDAGIYAMGALVHELLARGEGLSDASRRVDIVTAPGISALQAAAARAGAPLGHDFCAISLSDLLTPRAEIERRVRAAADGDFVIAFYNPVSRRRRDLFPWAQRVLLGQRPASTPVVLASSLGRPAERVQVLELVDVTVEHLDMLTVAIVGSSQSARADIGGGSRVYTPRGYAAKLDGASG